MHLKTVFNTVGRFSKTLGIFILLTVLSLTAASASDPFQKIKNMISPGDAVLLASPAGDILFSINPDKKIIPASTLKVLTSLVAIQYLSESYRFPTDFFMDDQSNLIIKGYGDPLLISEEVKKIAVALRVHIDSINNIILDDTYFEKPLTIPGTVKGSMQPYDAPNGALCVNFNTVNFKIEKNKIISAESQTPVVNIARQKIKSVNPQSGRILLTNNGDEITRYTGEIFQYFLEAEGIAVKGGIKLGKAEPSGHRRIYRHLSTCDLTQTLSSLLEYSNNFIANQLLLSVGAHVFGPPATMEKGVEAAKQYVAQKFDYKNLALAEGSGISRDNRLTARLFLQILSEFRPHHALMQHKDNEYYKTGTLNGISTRVGYIVSSKGELYPFAVFINSPKTTTAPVMKELKKLIH